MNVLLRPLSETPAQPEFPWPGAAGMACCPRVLAVIKQAAESASVQDWFHGYPPWLVVLVGAVLAAVILWIFAKIMKVVIWILIALVLVGGLATAAKMYLDETAPPARKAENLKS